MELCDVTIREGEQMPGRSYSTEQKVAATNALERLDLDYVQIGFPAQGRDEIVDCRAMIDATDTTTTVIARAMESDVDAGLETGADVVEVIAPLSDRQLEHAIGESREEMWSAIGDAIDRVDDGGATAHVVLVDAFRTETRHLVDAFEAFPTADRITIADSVGARTPAGVRDVLETLDDANVDLGRAGVHFHDDLGLAAANALVADSAGVEKIDVSVGSLGERAGNTPIEQVVAGRTTAGDPPGVRTGELVPVCRSVLEALDESISPRKPVLGEDVYTHEAGIHTAVMLDHPDVFEPYAPDEFGARRRLQFGAKTGRTGARKLLERAGHEATDGRIEAFRETLRDRGPVDLETALELAERVDQSGESSE